MVNPFIAVIEKIEGKFAVLELEDTSQVTMPLKYLPENIKEGAVVKITIIADPAAEQERRNKIKDLHEKLTHKNPGC
jgi:hypothetical protein